METDLVFDQAIYSKVLEVVMEEQISDLRDFINLRMGDFHATCVYSGVIGKQFSDAGLKDVMVKAVVLGEYAAQIKNKKLRWNKKNKNYTGMVMNM